MPRFGGRAIGKRVVCEQSFCARKASYRRAQSSVELDAHFGCELDVQLVPQLDLEGDGQRIRLWRRVRTHPLIHAADEDVPVVVEPLVRALQPCLVPYLACSAASV